MFERKENGTNDILVVTKILITKARYAYLVPSCYCLKAKDDAQPRDYAIARFHGRTKRPSTEVASRVRNQH